MTSLSLLVASCNEHIFQVVTPIHTRTVVTPKRIDIGRAADILFVIDNSGSMSEEQDNLARNISSVGSGVCDGADFQALENYLDGPGRDVPQEQWPNQYRQTYDGCGFIERLQLFNNRFHIGVITTDMNDCDKASVAGRPSRPQRGCLQSSEADPQLTVLQWDTPGLSAKLSNIVRNVQVGGSPYEKGLETVKHFLSPGHNVPAVDACDLARDCSNDLENFMRDREVNASGDEVETKLVVIYLTDEEDCSHGDSIDEGVQGNTSRCYDQQELLTPVQSYVNFLRTLKRRPDLVAVAVIGGLWDSGAGMRPDGCKLGGGATNQCDPAGGNSIATCDNLTPSCQPVCQCHIEIDRPSSDPQCPSVHFPATNCCEADPAARYYQLATQMEAYKIDTICSSSYRETMIAIADLVNETGSVVLPERPRDENSIVVRIRGQRWNNEWTDVPHYDESTDTPPGGGWDLVDDGTRVKFFGDWVPEPGDEVQVMFLGQDG